MKFLLLEIKESFLISLAAIKANKSRSFLATLGIVIGITTVTILQTAIEGINIAFEKSIAAVTSLLRTSTDKIEVYDKGVENWINETI